MILHLSEHIRCRLTASITIAQLIRNVLASVDWLSLVAQQSTFIVDSVLTTKPKDPNRSVSESN